MRSANIVTLLIGLFLSLPFAVITWIYLPAIIHLPMLVIAVCIGYFVLMGIGHRNLARFLVVIGPAVLISYSGIYLSGPEEQPLAICRFLSMFFIILPFLVIDTRERWLLALTVTCSGAIIVLLPVAQTWITADISDAQARLSLTILMERGWVSYFLYISTIVAASAALLGLSRISRRAETESDQARLEAEMKTDALQQEKQIANETLAKLEDAQHTENQRRWAAEGIAQLTDLTRTQSDDKANTLYDRVVVHFVKYLEANQGGLYIVDRENEEEEVRLEACYAYDRKKYAQKTIAPGEGLVGQVFLERQPIRLTEIPEDYVNITSGLGKANPRSLVIVPLMVNEAVEGILEIATFKVVEDHHLDFLEKAGESLASFIQMNRINTKTRVLLAEAQQQAEEMRAQEEEMRQNLEELAATQEEMNRKEQAYQNKIAELERQQATA